MPLTLETIHASDVHSYVRLVGQLDLDGVRSVELKFTASTASRRTHAIVDLSEVTFIASLGMGMLVGVARALAAGKHRLVLVAPQAHVATALRTARLESIMPIAADLDAARALVGAAAT
jgi:anti-sigma B factor antagonist